MVKAVVLTYDRQVGLAELAVKSYLQFWKECPFQFVIPQNDPNSPDFEFLRRQNNVTMVGTPSSMPETMSKLLERFEDDAWLYWCIDDRYPISLDVHRLEAIVAFIESGAAESLNAIKLIHWREKPDQGREDIQIGDATFRFQAPVSTWGFWHHHFLKAKVLKNLFLMLPDALAENPRAWNAHLNNLPTIEAFKETVFPVGDPVVEFGETLLEGRLTANACEALAKYNCPVPPYPKAAASRFFQSARSCSVEEEFGLTRV